MSWNPDLYLNHATPRMRPASDLLARIDLPRARQIVDLGCGPGTVTQLLAANWPEAEISGVDNSAEMLARARRDQPGRHWLQADIASWQPEQAPDLIFSNAALHWLPGHAELLPRLVGMLASGGIMAVQMPANFDAPSHRLLRELADEPPWAVRLEGVRHGGLLGADDYFRLLTPCCAALDVWETIYWHVLAGEDAVLTWMRASALLPYLAALDESSAASFLDTYRKRLLQAYPPSSDGTVIFPFKRLFIIARAR